MLLLATDQDQTRSFSDAGSCPVCPTADTAGRPSRLTTASPPAERPTLIEVGEADSRSTAVLTGIFGRAPCRASVVAAVVNTSKSWRGRNKQKRQGGYSGSHVSTRSPRRHGRVTPAARRYRVPWPSLC